MDPECRRSSRRFAWLEAGILLGLLLAPFPGTTGAALADVGGSGSVIFGVRISAGGRYDNVRKCVVTSSGTKGGPAADISVFSEVGLSDNVSLIVNVPVFRPILFGAAFNMLQFEPEVTLAFRRRGSGSVDFVAGPSLGVSVHYGPDFTSDRSGPGRKPSFFALGPTIGAYLGLDFKRPDHTFNFQLGLRPYVTPLFSLGDPDQHRGVVVGGLLEGQLRLSRGR